MKNLFWLASDKYNDKNQPIVRMGVANCNANGEVTQLSLAGIGEVYDDPDRTQGFIPEEIKWLKSLESLDLEQSNLVCMYTLSFVRMHVLALSHTRSFTLTLSVRPNSCIIWRIS